VRVDTLEPALRKLVAAHPEAGLAGLRELRRTTADALDVLEEELVRRALSAGSTWVEIGRALGMSDSAAHRRFRHLAPPARRRRQTRLDV
jgi:hypothetical protein